MLLRAKPELAGFDILIPLHPCAGLRCAPRTFYS